MNKAEMKREKMRMMDMRKRSKSFDPKHVRAAKAAAYYAEKIEQLEQQGALPVELTLWKAKLAYSIKQSKDC